MLASWYKSCRKQSVGWESALRWLRPGLILVIVDHAVDPGAVVRGRQWIDEELLGELAGITNFDHYWCEGRPQAHPLYIDKW